MIDPKNINSGSEYAQLIIETILESEKTIPTQNQMPIGLLTYLAEEIQNLADITYNDYIIGKRESFLFSDVEFEELYNKAGERYVGDQIDDLVDKGMLEISVNENGEFLYGLSEKGKKTISNSKPTKPGRPKKK